MLRCNHCGVDLPGNPRQCPLCQSVPTGAADDAGRPFPRLPAAQRDGSVKLLAGMAFGSVCACVVCVVINLIFPTGGWWSLFIIAGIASLWADFAIMIKKRKNLQKSILWQVAAVTLLAYIWDRYTGFHGWSLDYVLPILCTCAMIGMTALAKIRKLHIQDYILYLIMDCILGIISLVLIFTSAVKVVIPSAVCFGSSVIFLAALLFFEGKALRAEIHRRLHL